MAEYILKRELELDRPRAEVFDFFADAGNLGRITPPELSFYIIGPRVPMFIGGWSANGVSHA